MQRGALILFALTFWWTTPTVHADDAADDKNRLGSIELELSLLPALQVRQIEGPARDDTVATDIGLVSALRADVALLPWLRAGLMVGLDVGNTTASSYSRPDRTGMTAVEREVGGGYWELWTTLMVRGEYGPVFAEVGWAPLIVRHDAARADLPNVRGETDGLFVGSRAVAYLLAVGGQLEVGDDLWLTLRLQFRIRYLVERGGAPLADQDEFGQMHLWPQLGLRYAL